MLIISNKAQKWHYPISLVCFFEKEKNTEIYNSISTFLKSKQ